MITGKPKDDSENLKLRTSLLPFRSQIWQKISGCDGMPVFSAGFSFRKSTGMFERQVFGGVLRAFFASCLLFFVFLNLIACGGGEAFDVRVESIRIINTHRNKSGSVSDALVIGEDPFGLELEFEPAGIAGEVGEKVVWKSNAPNVLECSADGMLTPKSEGAAVITASVGSGDDEVSDSMSFVVFSKDYSGSENDDFVFFYYYEGSANTDRVYLSKCLISQNRIEVPARVFFNGKACDVVCIGAEAFKGNDALGEIVLPDSVIKIERDAFSYCSNLESVHLSENLEAMEQGCFGFCGGLLSITLPPKVNSIGDSAFNGCSKLLEINNYSGLDISLDDAGSGRNDYFGGIAKSAVRINTDKARESESCIVKRDGIAYFKRDDDKLVAVKADSDLSRISGLGADCVSIRAGAFGYLQSLTEVDLTGSGIIEIGDSAFASCPSLSAVILNDGLRRIGSRAFANCSALLSLTVPDSVVEISESFLSGCSSLASLTVPFIGKYSNPDEKAEETEREKHPLGYFFSTSDFEGSYKAEQFFPYYNSNYSQWRYPARDYYIPSALKSVSITNSDELVFEAFENCVGLESVALNSGMTKLGAKSFRNCIGIKSIAIPDSVVEFGFDSDDEHNSYPFDGCLFEEVSYERNAAGGEYEFKNGVLTVKAMPSNVNSFPIWYADQINPLVLEVVFSESAAVATSIPRNAFRDCASLKRISLPDSVATIKERAFYDCASLETLASASTEEGFVVPDGVVAIEDEAFAFCGSITKVSVPESVTSIGSGAFGGCALIREMVLPFVGMGAASSSGNKYHFGHVFGKDIKFSSDLAEKVEQPSSSSSSNPKYWIPKSVKSVEILGGDVGCGAFNGCKYIESVRLDDSVESVGMWAFCGCLGLRDVTLPSGLGSLSGQQCFSNCISLSGIVIPASCETISSGVFECVSQLAEDWDFNIFLENDTGALPIGYAEGWNRKTDLSNHSYYFYSAYDPVSPEGYWHYDSEGNPRTWAESD